MKSFIVSSIVFGALFLIGQGQAVGQETYKRLPVRQVERVLSDMGIDFERSKDSSGDPLLKLKLLDVKVQIFFFDCSDNGCTSMQLHAGFRMDSKPPCSYVNEWNRTKRYGRLYLDSEGDIHIEYDVDFEGGVTTGVVKAAIEKFKVMLLVLAAQQLGK